MQQNYKQDQQYRVIVALVSLMLASIVILSLKLILPDPSDAKGQIFMADVLLDVRNTLFPFTIQNIMWLMFFLGLGELWVRFEHGTKEYQQLDYALLPEDEATMLRSKDLVPIYKNVTQLRSYHKFFLRRLLKRVIMQFQITKSIDQANNLMNTSLEMMQHEIDLKYNMLRYVMWLIPTLGFIGTVIGITMALSDGSAMPSIGDSQAIKDWVGTLTTSLGVAFNTTLVALIMSAILVFMMHVAQAREEMALNGSGQYCLDNLINRLYEE